MVAVSSGAVSVSSLPSRDKSIVSDCWFCVMFMGCSFGLPQDSGHCHGRYGEGGFFFFSLNEKPLKCNKEV